MVPGDGGTGLESVFPAALAAIGEADRVKVCNADAARDALEVPEARSAVVVLIDGLGRHQLDAMRGHARTLAGLGEGTIRAGFPSTTATSL